MLTITIICLGILLIANCYATWLVWQEETFESSKKTWQIALIWLIPALGSIFFISFIRSERQEATSRRFEGNSIEHGDPGPIDSHAFFDSTAGSSGE